VSSHGQERAQLVQTTGGKVQEVTRHGPVERDVEPGIPPDRVEQLVDRRPVALASDRERAVGVELADGESGRAARNAPLVIAPGHPQNIAERVGGIGGQNENPAARRRVAKRERHRSGTGRLTDAALAGDQEETDAWRRENSGPGACRPSRFRYSEPRRRDVPYPCACSIPTIRRGSPETSGERSERHRPAGLRGQLREEADRMGRERLANGRDRLVLCGESPAVHRASVLAEGSDTIHDDLPDRDAARRELANGVPGFLHRQHLGEDDPAEPAPLRVAEETREPAGFHVDLGDEIVGPVVPVSAREAREQEVVLREHLPEHRRDPPESVRDGQEPERVPGGRRVDDDGLVTTGLGDPRQLEEPTQLVHAREAQIEEAIDVRVVEISASLGDEAERSPAGPQPAAQGTIRVELQSPQRRPGYRHARHRRT
jgi:hypothetical protein